MIWCHEGGKKRFRPHANLLWDMCPDLSDRRCYSQSVYKTKKLSYLPRLQHTNVRKPKNRRLAKLQFPVHVLKQIHFSGIRSRGDWQWLPTVYNLNLKAASAWETSVTTYQLTSRHIPEDLTLQFICRCNSTTLSIHDQYPLRRSP